MTSTLDRVDTSSIGLDILDPRTLSLAEYSDVIDVAVSADESDVEVSQPRRSLRSRITAWVRTATTVITRIAVNVTNRVITTVIPRAYRYRARHRPIQTALGRDRSTSEYVSHYRRCSREPRTSEGELALRLSDTFVDQVQLCVQAIRAYHNTLHPNEQVTWGK
jgi:hypothetical protein